MIISLPEHKIIETQRIQPEDIPLSFIDTRENIYRPIIRTAKEFSEDKKEIVRAYRKIDDEHILFFDKDRNILPNIELKRLSNTHIFEPQNAIEYTPTMFSCHAVIRKMLTYDDVKKYNLKIAVGEETQTLPICESLIRIFANPVKNGFCPYNITINNGSSQKESLLSTPIRDCDFVFFKSEDGKTLPSGFDLNKVLDAATNAWLFVENFEGVIENFTAEELTQEGYLSPCYKETPRKNIPEKCFKELDTYPGYEGYVATLLYEDVLLLEKPNKAYVILSTTEFLDNINNNAKILYDVLIYVFLRSYFKSAEKLTWITDEPIDYIAHTNTKLNEYHSKINLNDLLYTKEYEIGNNYQLLSIETSNKNVNFVGMSPNNDLYFRKDKSIQKDPKKENGMISYLTTKNTVINYKQEDIYLLESSLYITYKMAKDKMYLNIAPIQSSTHKINTTKTQEIEIPDYFHDYYICTKTGSAIKENEFTIQQKDEYSMEEHGIILAEVKIESIPNPKAYDIRIFGGGIPITEKNDYNMIDIGNIYGRPLRNGSAIVVTLPLECKEYEKLIQKELEAHMSSGEYPVLLFQ